MEGHAKRVAEFMSKQAVFIPLICRRKVLKLTNYEKKADVIVTLILVDLLYLSHWETKKLQSASLIPASSVGLGSLSCLLPPTTGTCCPGLGWACLTWSSITLIICSQVGQEGGVEYSHPSAPQTRGSGGAILTDDCRDQACFTSV